MLADADHSHLNSLFVGMEKMAASEGLSRIIHQQQSHIDAAVCAACWCNITAAAGNFKGH